ncbi:hypothetical protein HMPREF0061_0226, partial [Aerococcus viridans ATCC 11563 = CCUG 4311]
YQLKILSQMLSTQMFLKLLLKVSIKQQSKCKNRNLRHTRYYITAI